jgi:hypothetical protein
MTNIVQHTITASLFVQFSALVISVLGLGVPVAPENLILRSVLGMEAVVQMVEMAFYTWFGVFFRDAAAKMDIARYRYLDWFVTTPVMLLSTMMFFRFKAGEKLTGDEGGEEAGAAEQPGLAGLWGRARRMAGHVTGFVRKNALPVAGVLGANAVMLACGFLGEIGRMGKAASQGLGFAAFAASFYWLHKYFAAGSSDNYKIFLPMLFIWSLYGVAARFGNTVKNTSFNLLDMVSKNFYSVFIAWYIYSLSK